MEQKADLRRGRVSDNICAVRHAFQTGFHFAARKPAVEPHRRRPCNAKGVRVYRIHVHDAGSGSITKSKKKGKREKKRKERSGQGENRARQGGWSLVATALCSNREESAGGSRMLTEEAPAEGRAVEIKRERNRKKESREWPTTEWSERNCPYDSAVASASKA